MSALPDIEVMARADEEDLLTPEAIAFLASLHLELNSAREDLLVRRAERQEEILTGELPDFLPSTIAVRNDSDWRVAPAPSDLQDRRVEITGPTDRKMVINALNSGAKVFMADFEDANTPHWSNLVHGQRNLIDAVRRTISLRTQERTYRLNDEIATLAVRPRGWHLVEEHVRVNERPISASLFDFGLFLFHNAHELLERGTGPYFYIPKLEGHIEARLWNQAFEFSQDALRIPRGTIKATVLIETVLAAFEMDEILYELRDHSAGLNAGRWDYIFSIIKKFRHRPDCLLPDRAQITMTVPFMRAYSDLLVRTCHRRAAHAIGGMAAFIPNRKDAEVNETALARVREDKLREANAGFDGTWVAHPDLVKTAMEPFDAVLGTRPNQVDRLRDDIAVDRFELLHIHVPGGRITEDGLRGNIGVGIRYLASWLRGSGAATIGHLMEDTATAEIARSQVWQWMHQNARLSDGRTVDADLVRRLEEEELDTLLRDLGSGAFKEGQYEEARDLFEEVALTPNFVEFLTLPAYERVK